MSGIFVNDDPLGYVFLDDLGFVRLEERKSRKSYGVFDLEWNVEDVLKISEGEIFNPSGSEWQITLSSGELRFEMVGNDEHWLGAYSIRISRDQLAEVYEEMKERIEEGRQRLYHQMMMAEI